MQDMSVKAMEIGKMSGRIIRASRAVLGWSTKDLAEKAGVGVATLNRFERQDGIYTRATVETTQLIMNAIIAGLDSIGWRFTSSGGLEPINEQKQDTDRKDS